MPSFAADDLVEDLRRELERLQLSRHRASRRRRSDPAGNRIPVVKLVIPGLEGDIRHPDYTPGSGVPVQSPPMKAIIFAGPSLPPASRPADLAPRVAPAGAARRSQSRGARPPGYHRRHRRLFRNQSRRSGTRRSCGPWPRHPRLRRASIGALRAAELARLRHGRDRPRFYEAFRDGMLDDDDEVAVLHGPEELGYAAVTEAMVNIRATLDRAVAEGILDSWLVPRLARNRQGSLLQRAPTGRRSYTSPPGVACPRCRSTNWRDGSALGASNRSVSIYWR